MACMDNHRPSVQNAFAVLSDYFRDIPKILAQWESEQPERQHNQPMLKIVTWNVRGICSPSKRYRMWKSIFNSQWDILCVVEHKEHAKSGSSLCWSHQGAIFRCTMLIVRDSLKPVVVQRDVHGRFLVVEVNYEGRQIWVVGIYGSNVARQRMDLRRCLNPQYR